MLRDLNGPRSGIKGHMGPTPKEKKIIKDKTKRETKERRTDAEGGCELFFLIFSL